MAADVITRFKLETTQFDSKLRDAAKGLREYTHQAELGGKSFTDFSQKSVEAARTLGNIASGATNAKDKVKDLVGAYNEAAKAYNSLSQQQQQSDFGKALAESLGVLKERITDAKQELYGLGEAIDKVKGSGGGGLFGEGGITGMLQVAGGNLLAEGITKIGSEIADTVQQSIELARQGEGVRIAFERLNQPNLLNNLKEATHGTVSELELMKQAIKFDNFKLPLEDLSTYLAFAQQKAKDTGESIDYLVDSIVTGLGRQSKQILDNLGISAAELTKRMGEGKDMTQAVAEIIREEMQKAGDYVETAADRAAKAAADAQNQMEEFGRAATPIAEEWATAWNDIKTAGMEVLTYVLSPIADSILSIRELLSQEYTLKIKAEYDNGLGPNIDDNGNYIKKPSNGNWAGYDAANGRYFNEIASMPEITVTGTKPRKKTGGSRGGSSFNVNKIAFNPAEIAKPADYKDVPSVWKEYGEAIGLSMTEGIEDTFENLSLENWTTNFDPMAGIAKDGKDIQKSFQAASSSVASLGSALSGLEDPGAKILSIVMQGIAGVAQGAGMALGKAGETSSSWYEWLAAAAAITAQMIVTISQIHSSTGYAEGGIIKGNSYSGDHIGGIVDGSQFVGLNAGEVVLNKAQTNNLANALQGAGGVMNIQGVLQGENILLSVKRTLKRTGQGELLTWG